MNTLDSLQKGRSRKDPNDRDGIERVRKLRQCKYNTKGEEHERSNQEKE